MDVQKMNWQRLARSAVYTEAYCVRLLDDILQGTGKESWTLQELKSLWKRAASGDQTWGEFTQEEIARVLKS
jgi:hypothetical protein